MTEESADKVTLIYTTAEIHVAKLYVYVYCTHYGMICHDTEQNESTPLNSTAALA